MMPRERVKLSLSHIEPDRLPIDYFFFGTPEVIKRLKQHLGLNSDEQLRRFFGVDIRVVAPRYIGPELQKFPDGSYEDEWGVMRKPVSYGLGFYDEIIHYPLAEAQEVSDLDKIRWPKLEWWDFSSVKKDIERINEKEEYAICIANGNLFETSWYMRGLENLLVDFIINPLFANELMSRVTNFKIEYLRTILEEASGMIDIVFTADDVATQRGLLMSIDLWKNSIKPWHMRMNKKLKSYGIRIMYHSDGAVMEIIPELIDMGIDILDPIQLGADSMDPYGLKSLYGDKLSFHGGIGVQDVLPKGNPEEVRRYVRYLKKTLGRNGGYIIAPSHAIQPDTPIENILAAFEEAKSTI